MDAMAKKKTCVLLCLKTYRDLALLQVTNTLIASSEDKSFIYKKVTLSRYRAGQALGVPGG